MTDAALIRNAENRRKSAPYLDLAMHRDDRRNLHFKLAQHYGRKCRQVFPHGDWKQHESRIASGWSYMARDLPWKEACEAVHEGWDMVGFDQRAMLFSAINDEDEDDFDADGAPGRGRHAIQ